MEEGHRAAPPAMGGRTAGSAPETDGIRKNPRRASRGTTVRHAGQAKKRQLPGSRTDAPSHTSASVHTRADRPSRRKGNTARKKSGGPPRPEKALRLEDPSGNKYTVRPPKKQPKRRIFGKIVIAHKIHRAAT